ncbi:MAG: hypothetical protein ACJ72E_05455 [Marmoricola sp.]
MAPLLVIGLAVPSAQARAGVPTVSGVTLIGQDWYGSRLRVKWRAVAGATYQVRWAYKTSVLGRAKRVASRTASAYSPSLSNRCIPWYVQVRAIKSGHAGKWSGAKRVVFKNSLPSTPAYSTSSQTSSSQAQVHWSYTPYVAKYRLHWSPAPFDKWTGFTGYTPFVGQTARSAAINLPAVGPGDKFMNVAYGNPVFAQMQYTNGCVSNVRQSTFFPVWPKPHDPGVGSGDPVWFGTYNVEDVPTAAKNATKIADIADNIASHYLDVVSLQEASLTTANDIVNQLDLGEQQSDWEVVPSGRSAAQQIIFRSGRYKVDSSGTFGQAQDSSASTPLITPWAELERVTPGDPRSQHFEVMAVHLEEPVTDDVPTKKAATHAAAASLLRELTAQNTAHLPVIAAGDLKGNFNGYCDENSRPACQPEGQPTFIRGGFYDAQGAVTKVGIQYNTVNKHVADQPANLSGFGGRADFILLDGFTGSNRYEVVHRTYGNASSAYQPDHNLVTAEVFVPYGS